MTAPPPPLGLLAELTHRCPLSCPYCSNPLDLAPASAELDTATWLELFDQAAELGVLQLHLSGGEPLARRDLETLVARARARGLYSNLITAGVQLDAQRTRALADAGLDHVQLSVQDADAAGAERIGGFRNAQARKRRAAEQVLAAGLPLTLNAVVHRQNLDRLQQLIELALAWGARRLEVAHVQYHGWALANRAALMPTRAQVDRADAVVAEARRRLAGRLVIDYVPPDHHAERPKPCMGGWGRQLLVVTPAGKVLPCHAAESLPGLAFETVHERPLASIWHDGPAFERFRGTAWMPEPCRSCDRREVDFGGCRCQAYALTGDPAATDPACALSPHHARLASRTDTEAAAGADGFVYRGVKRGAAAGGRR